MQLSKKTANYVLWIALLGQFLESHVVILFILFIKQLTVQLIPISLISISASLSNMVQVNLSNIIIGWENYLRKEVINFPEVTVSKFSKS